MKEAKRLEKKREKKGDEKESVESRKKRRDK